MKKLIKNESSLNEYIAEIKQTDFSKGKTYWFERKLKRNIRSLKQNNYLWLCLGCIYESTGNEPQDMYDYFIMLYGPAIEKTVNGETFYTKLTTSKMDSKQLTTFVDNMRQFSYHKFKITFPDPNSQHINEFYEEYSKYIR